MHTEDITQIHVCSERSRVPAGDAARVTEVLEESCCCFLILKRCSAHHCAFVRITVHLMPQVGCLVDATRNGLQGHPEGVWECSAGIQLCHVDSVQACFGETDLHAHLIGQSVYIRRPSQCASIRGTCAEPEPNDTQLRDERDRKRNSPPLEKPVDSVEPVYEWYQATCFSTRGVHQNEAIQIQNTLRSDVLSSNCGRGV